MPLIEAKLLLGLLISCSADPKQFSQARNHYYKLIQGQSEQLDSVSEQFDKLHTACPQEPTTLAYWGSTRLLLASRTWLLWKKNSLSREGIQALDNAVHAEPSNLEARFVRAATTYNLPAFFHRKKQSADDFAYLAKHAESAVQEGLLEPRLAAASLYFHAEFLRADHRQKEAVGAWKLAIRLAPDSPAARDAATALKRLE